MKKLDSNFRGITPIYKPSGPTSHTIVNRVRQYTGEKKVGHAGTLDPLAEGVLVVAIGREFTKKLGVFLKKDKEYLAEIKLGQTSFTDDAEGVIAKPHSKSDLESIQKEELPLTKDIYNLLPQFTGEIWQVPPLYSAVKINGKPAYKSARTGRKVQLEPRKRVVKKIDLLTYSWPICKLRIVTGSGVYIRSIARDLGEELGFGGYLASLVRTRVGQYTLDESHHL